MYLKRLVRASAAGLLCSLSLLAQNSAISVTAEDLVRIALERNREYLAARERVAEAEALVRQAGLRPSAVRTRDSLRPDRGSVGLYRPKRVVARVERGELVEVTRRRDLRRPCDHSGGSDVVDAESVTTVDSSALVPRYVPKPFSATAQCAVRDAKEVPFTVLRSLEAPNAFQVLVGRVLITARNARLGRRCGKRRHGTGAPAGSNRRASRPIDLQGGVKSWLSPSSTDHRP